MWNVTSDLCNCGLSGLAGCLSLYLQVLQSILLLMLPWRLQMLKRQLQLRCPKISQKEVISEDLTFGLGRFCRRGSLFSFRKKRGGSSSPEKKIAWF